MNRKTIRRRQVEWAISKIKDALSSSKMENADFSGMGFSESDRVVAEKDVTTFIKNRTALYRNSWITGPLFRAIKILEGELNR